ncbi:MAG: RCC1 domain-containing protein [Streptosporangiaceae bacterium]
MAALPPAGRPWGWRLPSLTAVLAAGSVLTAIAVAPQAAAQPAARPRAGQGSAATTAAGALRAWGSNDRGQLGIGVTSAGKALPVTVALPARTQVTSVREGEEFSLARTSTGRILAWGDNSFGQLGDGTRTRQTRPVYVKLPNGTTAAAARAGSSFGLALTSTGRVLAWGDNREGELGDGSTTSRTRPVPVKLPAGVTVKAISAGCQDGFALTTTGKLWAWGDNAFGQLGDGTTTSRLKPVRVKVPARDTVDTIAAGCDHALATFTGGLLSGGLLVWGHNEQGQLGDGSTTDEHSPESVVFLFRGPGPGRLTQVFAGNGFSMALFSKGGILAWGGNFWGELGNATMGPGTDSDKPVGVMLPSGTHVVAIGAGDNDSYAVTTGGRVLAWGYNVFGQLGNGTAPTASDIPVPVHLPGNLRATGIGAGPAAFAAFAIVRKR